MYYSFWDTILFCILKIVNIGKTAYINPYCIIFSRFFLKKL